MSLLDGLPPYVKKKIEENYIRLEERARRFYEKYEQKKKF